MKYEIPREMFKQRLGDKHNFVFVDLQGGTPFDGTVGIGFDENFLSSFSSQYPKKEQNVILFSLKEGDEAPQRAADALSTAGYHYVYFYRGSPRDLVLDKGLN
jgi:hypothetical protein